MTQTGSMRLPGFAAPASLHRSSALYTTPSASLASGRSRRGEGTAQGSVSPALVFPFPEGALGDKPLPFGDSFDNLCTECQNACRRLPRGPERRMCMQECDVFCQ